MNILANSDLYDMMIKNWANTRGGIYNNDQIDDSSDIVKIRGFESVSPHKRLRYLWKLSE